MFHQTDARFEAIRSNSGFDGGGRADLADVTKRDAYTGLFGAGWQPRELGL